ncbi:hypothetical protein FSP39_021808 [Pinctada imbricata]|uniref:BTB domain-containing protein n=1 Tax=Pinctada imbricata TaxID=66713 RepID=A0AA88Y4C0_PINIB|nr:hypothetical protein FSP39_021808 [Pinctada imbricata]
MEPVEDSALQVRVDEEGGLEDVALVVEGEKLLTSRCLLAYASPVFKSMFTSQFKERNQSEIELPGKLSHDVAELLRFLNPGTADVLEDGIESAMRLLPLAEEYQIKKLTNKCEETLLAEIESNKPQDFIIRCIQIADRYDLNNLLSYCIEKCSLSRSLWTLVKENGDISVEVKALVYEGRLQKLEEDKENYLCLKQRMNVVKNRLRDIITPHENHCRCPYRAQTEVSDAKNVQFLRATLVFGSREFGFVPEFVLVPL